MKKTKKHEWSNVDTEGHTLECIDCNEHISIYKSQEWDEKIDGLCKVKGFTNPYFRFENTVFALIDSGYAVEVDLNCLTSGEKYEFARFEGKGVKGVFACRHNDGDPLGSKELSDKIFASPISTFTTIKESAIQRFLPNSEESLEELLSRLKFWGDEKNAEISAHGEFDEFNDFVTV